MNSKKVCEAIAPSACEFRWALYASAPYNKRRNLSRCSGDVPIAEDPDGGIWSPQSQLHPSAERRTHVKVAPGPASADAQSRPPCASTIERLIRSPIPMLFGLVE